MLNAVAPAPVDRAIPAVRALADEAVGRFAGRGEADLIAEWAKPIPSGSVAVVLGLPVEDCQRHGAWTTDIILGAARMSPSHPEFSEAPSAAAYGSAEGTPPFAYLMEHLEKRRNGEVVDEEDGMTAMLAARHPQTGEPYRDFEIVEAVNTMLAAGNETTTSLMGNLVWRLAQQPDLYAAIRDDRSLVRAAIEESLRLDPPQQIFERVCMHDTEVAGVEFHAGEPVILSLASGNRDEHVYGDDADEFRLDRELPNPPNWSMGGGIHVCVGAHLARHRGDRTRRAARPRPRARARTRVRVPQARVPPLPRAAASRRRLPGELIPAAARRRRSAAGDCARGYSSWPG
jgi:cytochrome P450